MWRYRLPDYELKLIKELQKQQNSSLFCDTLLQTEGVSVPAHSCILAALSPYLSKALSAEPSVLPAGQRRPLKLQAVRAQTLLKLVGLLYSGELEGEGAKEHDEVMAAVCKLGIGRLLEGRKDRVAEERRRKCGLREAGVQTEPAESGTDVGLQTRAEEQRDGASQVELGALVELGTLVDTETQTVNVSKGPDTLGTSPPIDAIALMSASPPSPAPLTPLPVQSSSEGPQPTNPPAPISMSARGRAPSPHPSVALTPVDAAVSDGTGSCRTPEPEECSTDDFTTPSESSVILGSDVTSGNVLGQPASLGEESAIPECPVAESVVAVGRAELENRGVKRGQQLTSLEGRRARIKPCLTEKSALETKALSRSRKVDTQMSIKVKLRKRTRGQVWEVVRRKERDGCVTPARRQTALAALKKSPQDMKHVRTRSKSQQRVLSPQSPAIPLGGPLVPAFLTPPPDLPISPSAPSLPDHTSKAPNPQTPSCKLFTPVQQLTPHPAQETQPNFPQPAQVQESEEDIDKMLEDIMIGLNILPPSVMERHCHQEQLHSSGRPPDCSCSQHPEHTVAQLCGAQRPDGLARRYMCSHVCATGKDDPVEKETAFHSITSSHFVTTKTACSVTPKLHMESQRLTPQCCSSCLSTATHSPQHHPQCTCNDNHSDLAKCERTPYYSGGLQCASDQSQSNKVLQNQKSPNHESQDQNYQNQVVGIDSGSCGLAVDCGPSLGPPQQPQGLCQSRDSPLCTGEGEQDPGCSQRPAALSEAQSTERKHEGSQFSVDGQSKNGETTQVHVFRETAPSQINEDCSASHVNGETAPSQINKEIPASHVNELTTPNQANGEDILSPIQARRNQVVPREDPSEPQNTAIALESTSQKELNFPEQPSQIFQGSEIQPSQSPPPYWEELVIPKCLTPIHSPKHSPPQSLLKPLIKSPLRHTKTPFHRVPQVSQLPPWLCCSMKELQFPLSSMLQSTRCPGNPCPSKKEQWTDGQEKLPSISNNSKHAENNGKEESKRRNQNMVPTTTLTQIQGKQKARSKKRRVDELWEPPSCSKRKQTKEDCETVEPPLKKTRLSTKKEVGDKSPLLRNESLKRNNGQVKISLCSVSLSSNNVLLRKRRGRSFTTSKMTSIGEDVKESPEGTEMLRMKSGKPDRVLRAKDRDVKNLPSITGRPKRCISKQLQGFNKPDISFETVCPSSGLQTPAKADGLPEIPPPALKRKRGRPPKRQQMKNQVSLASNAQATVGHNGENVEHDNKKGELEGKSERNFAKLFQNLPVLPKHETTFQNSSQQTSSSIVYKEQGLSTCSEIGCGTILEPQASVQPQNCGTESSKENKCINTSAVKLSTTKDRAPTMSLRKFQELLKRKHQKTRKPTENQDSESEKEIEKSEGNLLEANEYDCSPNVSRKLKENKGSSRTPGSAGVEIDNQEDREEDNQSEEINKQHKHSTSRQNDIEHQIQNEPEPGNIPEPNNIEDTEKSKVRKNVDAPKKHFELQEEAVSTMESMTQTDKMGVETSSKEVEKIQVQQTVGYAVAEELSGDKEEIDIEEDDEEFNINLNNPTVYPDTAWKTNPGIKEVDKDGFTIASIRGFPHDCIDLSQNVNISMAADMILPTPSEVESSTLTSQRITTGSTGSWEPEEEDEVEVDVLECSPDIRPRELEAGQGVTDLTEEDEDMEEDEIDVTGDETA